MFDNARSKAQFSAFDTASHSFADTAARQWLLDQIATALA
jgi:1,2-phenylacetyl-CoA epoxidase catalytic subunit